MIITTTIYHEFWEELIVYFRLIRNGSHRKWRVQMLEAVFSLLCAPNCAGEGQLNLLLCYVHRHTEGLRHSAVAWKAPRVAKRKIRSWIPWESEPRITALARTSRNLAVSAETTVNQTCRLHRMTGGPLNRRGDPTSKLVQVYERRKNLVIYFDETWSQEWVCWRRPETI
jgi:hypothetical protein